MFEQEQEARSFFLLLDGHVRVVKSTPTGHMVTVRYIGAGELMGIASALGRTTYPANALAAVDCVVLAWPTHLWPTFATSFPSFSANDAVLPCSTDCSLIAFGPRRLPPWPALRWIKARSFFAG
ncbi:hypothetical protein MPL1032_160215 [Mesorhizobium plurifarium]|uniref:Cyclic nucleotide-binding domain-containing protein n=1 Tax=Mesorhizobium plurifarium TaxID=69974 RepID=A0A0K2VTQ0_MESPL|nr:hypothetical protein MPL1032_160215 [Mesorhizobium plurifarium]